ncbi:TauD/TfdA family dioxygenase [Micromonospora sp. LZ34]
MRDVDDLPHVDLCDPGSAARILSGLTTHGITIFHGGAERDDLLCTARSLIKIRTHRDSDFNGVTTIAQRPAPNDGRTSVAGFTDRELWPHTEGSAVCRPPRVLMLACLRPAQTGGRSHLVDGRDLYDEIARTEPAMLAALSQPRSAYFGGGSGHLGAVFEQTTEGRIAVRGSHSRPRCTGAWPSRFRGPRRSWQCPTCIGRTVSRSPRPGYRTGVSA